MTLDDVVGATVVGTDFETMRLEKNGEHFVVFIRDCECCGISLEVEPVRQ